LVCRSGSPERNKKKEKECHEKVFGRRLFLWIFVHLLQFIVLLSLKKVLRKHSKSTMQVLEFEKIKVRFELKSTNVLLPNYLIKP
jgi:hypothetical protein